MAIKQLACKHMYFWQLLVSVADVNFIGDNKQLEGCLHLQALNLISEQNVNFCGKGLVERFMFSMVF